MFSASVWFKHKAWQVFLEDGCLLAIRVVDGNLPLFQAGERPVAHSEFGGTLCGQDGLTGSHWFDLTPSTLQLLQKLTSAF